MQLPPFAQAQEAEELLVGPLAQLRLGQVFVRLPIRLPELEDADEFRLGIGELRMRGIGGGARIRRSLARVLDAEETGDHQHLAQHAVRVGGDQHARQLHVDRQLRHRPADGRELAVCVHRAELVQLLPAIGDCARIRRFQERERLDIAQTEGQHPQDHAGQRGATDFRIGERGARGEIGLGIQADAGTGGDAAATTGALVGACLADRFDVQAVELLARAVALDAGDAGIDHVMDARHGQRGLGDVGRQHDPPLRAGVEHAVLVLGRQPRVQRQHFGVAVLALLQRLVRFADLALTGQEDQGVTDAAVFLDFIASRDDAVEE